MNAIRYSETPGIGQAVLKLSQIRTDGGTQSRAGIDAAVVDDYAEAIRSGAVFPRVIVYFDGQTYWLADGFHRYHSHVKVGTPKIEADVRQGSRRDAVLFSVGANASHGLRRTNDDKRRAVMTLLDDEEWRRWNDVKIAEKCGVSSMFVGKVRKELSLNGLMMPSERTVERNGTTYQQNTATIGKSAPEPIGELPSGFGIRDDDEITVEDIENDPVLQKAVEALTNAKALADEVAAMPAREPLTPEQQAHYARVFGSQEDRQNFMKVINAVRLVDALPAPEQMAASVPPTVDHAVDVVAILKTSQWFEHFARAWERRKGAAA